MYHRDDLSLQLYETKSIRDVPPGTVKNGSVTCPRCGLTLKADRYRQLASQGKLGERLYGVVLRASDGKGRIYRTAQESDKKVFDDVARELSRFLKEHPYAIPTERLGYDEPRRLNVLHYGFSEWGQLFNDRQKLALATFGQVLGECHRIMMDKVDPEMATAVSSVLSLIVSNITQYNSNVSTWLSDGLVSAFIQSSSIPMRADYAEANPLMEKLVGGFLYQLDRTVELMGSGLITVVGSGSVDRSSATAQVLPDGSVDACVTDPPYYFAIPYADLSDFFYVWLKRFASGVHPSLFAEEVTPKEEEAVQSLPHSRSTSRKDRAHFEGQIAQAMSAVRKTLKANGVAVVVFAHASTEAWESLLGALLEAQLMITGSWPIDTERAARMLASRQRVLASSVHLLCRPRELGAGAQIGDWRDVLAELPKRIHEWMPRLAEEGVVGADAIFACLGPALEIFSRYSRVEKASGEQVPLREYLEHVWAAVSQEALRMVFEGADTTAFEEDARLTAMWLWTLKADTNGNGKDEETEAVSSGGYVLEYDAARKIAQGLGAHLDVLSNLVEIKGDKARLLPVDERGQYLFGKSDAPTTARRKKKRRQLNLFEEMDEAEAAEGGWGEGGAPSAGQTTLDRVHQAMLLFASGRGAALKRFLVEEGIGRDSRFWTLAQALSALYPSSTQEKRWVDGVLARKKGLGF